MNKRNQHLPCGPTQDPPKHERAERKRFPSSINSPVAARRMEAYIESRGMTQKDFAKRVKTTERTIRNFRRTGKLRRDIFGAVADEMGTNREDLLKAE